MKQNKQYFTFLYRLLYCASAALFLTIPVIGRTQVNHQGAEEIANAEKSFSKKALLTNTRDAFLEYYDDNVIIFKNGNPANGKDDWNKRNRDSSELRWQPVFSDGAISGDFGYTTGPWEWKKLKSDSMPSAYGYYNSIWKKGKDGRWKVMIDIGITTGRPSAEKNRPTGFSSIESNSTAKNYALLKSELLDVEKAFLIKCTKNNQTAYEEYISSEARLYRPNNLPYLSSDAIRQAVADTSLIFSFELVDGDIASSGDMAYVYGRTKATGIYHGQAVNADLNYMRIWKREKTGSWKIVLDVIGGG